MTTPPTPAAGGSAVPGALVVTAQPHEVTALHALLDSIDTDARAWVVLQAVTSDIAAEVAARPEVARVVPSDLVPLSHARNLALHEIFAVAAETGTMPNYVGFPDADGRYAPGALAEVGDAFAASVVGAGPDFVVGRYGPEDGAFDPIRFPAEPGVIDWALARQRATSVTLFLSGRTAYDLGYVMPYLGLGTPWPAGEDVELALRALQRGYVGAYVPAAITWHPYGTELNPARRPVRYLLVAAYPPPRAAVGTALRRLRGGHSVPAPSENPAPTAAATPAPSMGPGAEVQAAARGLAPSAIRRLRHFAKASPNAQWELVQRDGRTGAPPATLA